MSASSPWLVRWRVRVGYPVALACLWFARPSPSSLLWGAALGLCGLAIRSAAAGQLRKGEGLATSGPYAYTRNPLYLGSAILAAGFLVAANAWISAVILTVYFALFYPAVMRQEERELRTTCGAEFDAYAARVPLFLPRLTRGTSTHTRFSWAVYHRNREYQALLGFLLMLALLWLRWYWRA